MAGENLDQTGEELQAPPASEETQEGNTGQVTEPGDPAEAGQLEALKDERTKRQLAERQLYEAQLQAQNAMKLAEFYRGVLSSAQAPAAHEQIDPDMPPAFRDVDRLVNTRVGEVENELARVREEVRMQQLDMYEKQARKDHADFDDVMNLSVELAKTVPGLAAAIMNSPNPVEVAYNIGRGHPSFQKDIKTRTTQEVADKIARGLAQPKTLTSAGSGGSPKADVDYVKLAEEGKWAEIDAHRKKIVGY